MSRYAVVKAKALIDPLTDPGACTARSLGNSPIPPPRAMAELHPDWHVPRYLVPGILIESIGIA
jgi:hypothetical protein